MADFAPPSGPPPPKVPEGWKALWNEQYSEWFYVNTITKKSQWDKPTEPAHGPGQEGAPGGPPPNYDHGSSQSVQPEKSSLGTNNPYNQSDAGYDKHTNNNSNMSEDEKLARRLQAEEQQRAGSTGPTNRGASDSYYGGNSGPMQQTQYGQTTAPSQSSYAPQDNQKSKGFLSKISSKLSGGSSSRPSQQSGYAGYGQQQPQYYNQSQQYPPQQQYGGYPPQQYGGYPPQQYGGYVQQPKRSGGGMGTMGGAALGLGAGVLGGALIADAIDDREDAAYDQGYDDGGGGDDFGGGDF